MTQTMTRPPSTVDPPSPTGVSRRRRQMPWLLLGVLMMAGSMLGFALWSSSQSTRTVIVVAARTIDAGTVITEGDLSTATVAADEDVAVLAFDDIDLVLGEVARGPIPAGTPLHPSLVTTVAAVPAGHVVVGAALSPGEYPTSALRAGDRVEVVATTGSLVVTGAEPSAARTVSMATIWSVEELFGSSEQRLFVSLVVPTADADVVADLLDQERVRLLLVGADR